MITANELRIGNWVNMSLYDNVTPWKINSEDIDRFDWGGSKEFNPIPLTEEILLKLGHGKEGEVPSRLRLDCDFGVVLIPFKHPIDLCKYVHQYQNLYFALTGIELEVDLRNRDNG